jgi:uncharacterized membrane protein
MPYVILLLIHLLAAAFWVGGMATLHFAVRPAVAATLEPPLRLPTMAAVLRRFFVGVDAAVTLLFASGFAMIMLTGGFRSVHWRIQAMMGIALVMAGVYVYIRAAVFPALRRAVAQGAWPEAGARLGTVRMLVSLNLALGVAVFAVAIVGRAG